jgi:putative quorum-sensing-regulated virulence factor
VTMVMPWGKHKGVPLDQVPLGYLAWVLDVGYAARTPALLAGIRGEVARRLELHTTASPPPPRGRVGTPPQELGAVLGELVATGYKHLALRAHPDRGGTTAAMQRLNALRDWLRRQGWTA